MSKTQDRKSSSVSHIRRQLIRCTYFTTMSESHKLESLSSILNSAQLAIFLQEPNTKIDLKTFSSYKLYYKRTWDSLRNGDPPEADLMDSVNQEHITSIVEAICKTVQNGESCQRAVLKRELRGKSNFASHSNESLNRTIDLALRLWLVLNIRDEDFAPGMCSVQWDDTTPLQSFIATQFPRPRFLKELSEKMFDFALPESFNMRNLKRWSGIKPEWTDNFSEHLDLDKDHRILKVFPLKQYMYALRKRLEVPK
jgi:hypothetical protein